MGSGGVPGDVGAWGAGGGAVRGGSSAAVSGAWAGDVAHGALGGLGRRIRAPSGCCGAVPDFLVGKGLYGHGGWVAGGAGPTFLFL